MSSFIYRRIMEPKATFSVSIVFQPSCEGAFVTGLRVFIAARLRVMLAAKSLGLLFALSLLGPALGMALFLLMHGL